MAIEVMDKPIKINTGSCELHFMENRVVHAHFDAGRVVNIPDVQSMFDAMYERCEGMKNLLVVSVAEGTTLSNEARAMVSSADASKYIVADAILVRDFQHQLSANAFIRHNKPVRPVETFDKMEDALAWLETQRHRL